MMNSVDSERKLNILILHWLRDPREARDVLLKLLYFLKKYQPEHNYLYHDVSLPIPEYVNDIKFDAVILDVTLLCLRYPYHKIYLNKFIETFSFIKNIEALKIAFPQDDYDCSEILDEWMVDWKVDYVFSPLADNPDIYQIYKNYSKVGKIRLSFTGYIDEEHFRLNKYIKPYEEREIDIFYRARKLPPYFGWIGELKWRIADIVKDKAKNFNLKLDISYKYKYEDTLLGEKWYEYLGNSKFTLGSLSGSSLIDPRGELQQEIRKYCANNENYTYNEIEKLFFPGMDKYYFTAISPRNIEAAFTFTGQILVEGPYSGILKPWEHYIPLKPDGSNFDEVHEAMQDYTFVRKMIQNCYENLRSRKQLYYENLAQEIIGIILNESKVANNSFDKAASLIKRYNEEMQKRYERLYNFIRFKENVRKKLKRNKYIYNFAKYILNIIRRTV